MLGLDMNKLLKKLSKEAGLVADATYTKAPDAVWLKEYNKKFAELIIQECVEVARQADIDGCNIGNYAWEKIEQHFGVEQ